MHSLHHLHLQTKKIIFQTNLMYPVSSVMTSPGDTMCLGSSPAKAEIFFLFLGNLASTDISAIPFETSDAFKPETREICSPF